MALQIGEVLNNRYRITALLGQGGMGAVYRAWDLNLKMAVAVKENADASADAQRQFEREATLLAHLSHPNLPRVTDHFTLSGAGQYLVMDYVEGEDLESMLARLGALPEEQAVTWVSQVCDALAYLHQQDPPVIHRDIKPANIRIARDSRAMLVDFGISKLFEPGGRTTVGARAVTPGYSPPEQYGDGATDARSDTYALGATLYHLLTGSPPPESIKRMVNLAELAPPRSLNPVISPVVERAVLGALALPTDRRFQNAGALKAALAGGGSPAVEPVFAATPMMAAAVSHRADLDENTPWSGGGRIWAVAGVALLVLVALAGFLLVRGGLLGNGDGGQVEEPGVVDPTGRATPEAGNEAGTSTTAAVALASPMALPTKTTQPATTEADADPAGAQAIVASSPTVAPPTATPQPTFTPLPTPTPRCPVVEGAFAAEWATHEERLGCALGQPFSHSGAEERFEFGRMFWRSDAIDYGQALVAFNNGTWRIFEHAPFVEGSADFKCTDANTPPECPPTPKRGFGMMWCDIGAIRSGLGNATECEQPYTGLQQEFQRGFLLRTSSGTFVFLNDGAWQQE